MTYLQKMYDIGLIGPDKKYRKETWVIALECPRILDKNFQPDEKCYMLYSHCAKCWNEEYREVNTHARSTS